MNKPQYYLVIAGIAAVITLIFSLLSLGKLENVGIGDYNNLLIAFRIVNRDVLILSLAVLFLIIYLWIRQKK
jgi:phosphate starvation-inducible membrane PsiE